ncbi:MULTISPECIES: hypothetical protein [Bacillaceae]|uniref:Uncharacterized protein n=1 Tax=Domibacillus aminovorans TaxID=29332 RepID=A0A177KX74_9BACI|nr:MULTISPECIES: hypothetical protein [Bacillaceae]OAH57746.1 hypothetical protein AWH48_01625 [Domibacillus aminovorans]
MKLLEAVKLPGLYRLWNSERKEVSEALFFGEISRSIGDNETDWNPNIFSWINEREFNFEDWQEVDVEILPTVITEQC